MQLQVPGKKDYNIMNLRKKKEKFSYQDSQFLSKNYEYEELTKGKHRREKTPPKKGPTEKKVADSKDYTLIFSQLMDSIRRNLGQTKMQEAVSESDEEVLGPRQQQPRDKIKKRVELQEKEMKEGEQQQDMFKNLNRDKRVLQNQSSAKQRKLYRFSNHTRAQIQKISSEAPVTTSHNKNTTSLPHKTQQAVTLQQSRVQSVLSPSDASHLPSPLKYYGAFPLNGIPPQPPSTLPKQVKATRSGKLFKRSSFHIAIAYYIHLKKNQYYSDPLEIDPTYHSKRLRQMVQLRSI